MHYGIVVIGQTISFSWKSGVTIVIFKTGKLDAVWKIYSQVFIFIELALEQRLDVFPDDVNKSIPVNSVLLMPKAHAVEHLVDDYLFHLEKKFKYIVRGQSQTIASHCSLAKSLTTQPFPKLMRPSVLAPTLAKHPSSSFLILTYSCSFPALESHLTHESNSMSEMEEAITRRSDSVKSASIV